MRGDEKAAAVILGFWIMLKQHFWDGSLLGILEGILHYCRYIMKFGHGTGGILYAGTSGNFQYW